MEKFVIIGSAGAGKSIFAQELSSILKIKVYHLDRIFWRHGWKERPRDERIDILQKIVQERQWIIEGTYLGSSAPRLDAADTIIFLDMNPLLCLQRIIKRHWGYRGRSRRDIPDGCHDELNLMRILKVLGFPVRGRIMLELKLCKYKSKQIIRLHSPKEIEEFLARLEPPDDKNKQFSKSLSPSRKKQFATAK